MPRNLSKRLALVDATSYCSAPPLATSSHLLLSPRLTRAKEARRKRAPLREVKREVWESEADLAEYAVDASDESDIKPDIKPVIERNPRQLTACVAAIAIRRLPSAVSEEAQRPSTSNYRTQPLCSVPSARLGPADLPRRPGRPKVAKSRPQIAAVTTTITPPVRAAAAKACARMAAKPNRS